MLQGKPEVLLLSILRYRSFHEAILKWLLGSIM